MEHNAYIKQSNPKLSLLNYLGKIQKYIPYLHNKCPQLCRQCRQNCLSLQYIYRTHYSTTLCFYHFHSYCTVTVHYYCDNQIITFDTHTREKKTVFFPKEIARYSESISAIGRIFLMGNYNCTKDVYEADMVKAIMKPKADMLLKKYGQWKE